MKKGILGLLSFFLFISIFAQESYFTPTEREGIREGKSNFHGGVKVGFTASQITGDGFAFQGFNKLGAYLGVFANFPVSRSGVWLVQPELNFIMKGCKHFPKYDEYGFPVGNPYRYRLQLMYGQLPLLVKWRFYKGFELAAGPAFGLLFSVVDNEKLDNFLQVGAPPFFRFEFSGIIGLGYLFFSHLGVHLSVEHSLLPIRKPKASDWLFLDRGQHNQTFAFSVYYQF